MSEKIIKRKLGDDAWHLIHYALRGPHEERRFAWTGHPNYLPLDREYTILGPVDDIRERAGFFEVRDETTQEMKKIHYGFLGHFKEILAEPKQNSRTSPKYANFKNLENLKSTNPEDILKLKL